MGGSNSITALGLYYRSDPSYRSRSTPFVHEHFGVFRVCVAAGDLIRIVAECLSEEDAESLAEKYRSSAR